MPTRRAAAPLPQPGRPTTSQPSPAATHADILASARQLEQLGRYAEAQRAYLAMLQRHPQHVECMHRLAVVCTRLNDYDAARAYFDRALQIAPGNVSMLTDAGYARFLAGDHRQAEKLLRRATELAPKDVRATNNLAMVIGVSGRFDDALALFWQVNPHSVAWTNLARVYQMRNEPEQALTCYRHARDLDPSILVPEELLAQTAPPEPAVAEADLPPPPISSPSRTAPRRSTVASRPAHPLSVPATSTPLRFDERIAAEPELAPPPPAVVSANVGARNISEQDYDFSLPILATRKQPVEVVEAPPIAAMQADAPPRAEPLRARILPRQPQDDEPALVEPPGDLPNHEDPFAKSLRDDQPSTVSQELPANDEAPALVTQDHREIPATADQVADESPFLTESAPTPADEAPPHVEAQSRSLAPIRDAAGPLAPFAGDSDEEAPTVGAVDAFIDSEHAKLATRTQRDGLKGFCLVALFEERRLVDTRSQYALEYRAQEYQFSSSAAVERFKADPQRYVPANGGLDVVAARDGRDAVPGSLDFACWYRDRLYMFASQEHKDQFRADPRNFVGEK